jgi:hypothetical protein
MSFINSLYNLWPNGDERVPGLRDGIAISALTVFPKYGITTPLLIAHVMAQVSHECGAGHDVIENLNYSATRIRQVWPSRFATVEAAAPYANNPQKLANKVYNGRLGNRVGSNDGWNFRGRGGSQTTGRDGYKRVASSDRPRRRQQARSADRSALLPALRSVRFHQLRLLALCPAGQRRRGLGCSERRRSEGCQQGHRPP